MSSHQVPSPTSSFSSGKRWRSRASLVLGVFLSVYVLYLANGIVYRHPIRFDLTAERLLSLSAASLQKVKLVTEEIQVVIPTLLLQDNMEHRAYHGILSRTRLLLTELNAANPLIRLPIEVDVILQAERWEQVRATYNIESSQVNRLLFYAGPARERRQTVTLQDLATLEPVRDPTISVPPVKFFRGERALMDAIGRLMSIEKRTIYFTQDKGELPLRIAGETGVTLAGVRDWQRDLEADGFESKALNLATAREIPSNCALLVIVGASRPYGKEELRVLDTYLRRGGKMLLALGVPRTGVEDLLAEWGVTVPNGKIQAERVTDLTRTLSAVIPAQGFSTSHPATANFVNAQRFEVHFELPRPLSAGGKGKGLEVSPLVSARSAGGGYSFYLVLEPGKAARPVAEDFDLVVAVEQHVPERPPPEFQRLEARLLVAGSASFLGDKYLLRASNRDFLRNAVAWLLGEEEKTSEGSIEWTRRTLKMSPSIQRYLFWVPIFLLPGVFLVAGIIVYFSRRT